MNLLASLRRLTSLLCMTLLALYPSRDISYAILRALAPTSRKSLFVEELHFLVSEDRWLLGRIYKHKVNYSYIKNSTVYYDPPLEMNDWFIFCMSVSKLDLYNNNLKQVNITWIILYSLSCFCWFDFLLLLFSYYFRKLKCV